MATPLTAQSELTESSPLAARREALRRRRWDRHLSRSSPAERATLERLGSALRHSAVEAVLQNLKFTAQALAEAPADEALGIRLQEHLSRVPDLRAPLEHYFQRQRLGSTSLRHIFTEEHWACRRALERLERLGSPRAAEIPALVDAIMESLRTVDAAIRAHRVSPGALAVFAIRALEPLARGQGVSVHSDETLGSLPEIHLDQELASDALTEVLRNALRHAFPAVHRGERRVQASGFADKTSVSVCVHDTGAGMSAQSGRRGETHGTDLIRQIMRSAAGDVHWETPASGGTAVTLRWPLTPPGTEED